MRLEDAFKQSDIPAAKRTENGSWVVIRYLSNNQGILMRRVFPAVKQSGLAELQDQEEAFPHLGALLNNALKKGYTEIKRYANDWQPLFYATGEKAQTSWKAVLTKSYKDEDEDEYHDMEEKFTFLDPAETGDLDVDRDLERGLDGRIEYNEDDPNVISSQGLYFWELLDENF